MLIPQKVVKRLELTYKTANELNKIIDQELPGHPPFKSQQLVIGGKSIQFHYCNIIPCIWALFGEPEFAGKLVFAPEKHYANHAKTCRVFNEMHTGNWWWSVQVRIVLLMSFKCFEWHQMQLKSQHPGATVIPLIISSDKTLLMLFCGKMAYPLYLTIGNIPKEIHQKPLHHAQMLIGYLPTTKLEGIQNKTTQCRALGNLFHSCMQHVLGPVSHYGETGIAMVSRDGVWRRCYPILASFVGDYPKQVLMTCTYYGHCLKCLVSQDQLGKHMQFLPQDHDEAIETYSLADGNVVHSMQCLVKLDSRWYSIRFGSLFHWWTSFCRSPQMSFTSSFRVS